MTLKEKTPWIDQLSNWISESSSSTSNKDVQRLVEELDIAITMADSLVECSEQLQRLTYYWTQKYDKFQTNR